MPNACPNILSLLAGPHGMVGLFITASEESGKGSAGELGKVAIFEPNKSIVEYHDPDKLARTIAEMMVDDEFEAALRDVEVEEAVMVLLDVSRSMVRKSVLFRCSLMCLIPYSLVQNSHCDIML